jgi:hypothetical protein
MHVGTGEMRKSRLEHRPAFSFAAAVRRSEGRAIATLTILPSISFIVCFSPCPQCPSWWKPVSASAVIHDKGFDPSF